MPDIIAGITHYLCFENITLTPIILFVLTSLGSPDKMDAAKDISNEPVYMNCH